VGSTAAAGDGIFAAWLCCQMMTPTIAASSTAMTTSAMTII